MQGTPNSFASFAHSSTLICPAALAKLRSASSLSAHSRPRQLINRFDLNQLDSRRSQLVTARLRCDFWMITSDFIPARSGNCRIKASFLPVRIPARPD